MSHPRVVHVRDRHDVYVGRHRPGVAAPWGNPFTLEAHGKGAMVRYLDQLEIMPAFVARARRELAGKVLGCWCAPRTCHGEVLARLADGEALASIRDDLLARIFGGRS